jgi:hypothetical protein
MHAPARILQRLLWSARRAPAVLLPLAGCSTDPGPVFGKAPADPGQAAVALVDRFIGTPGSQHARSDDASLPAAGEPIDFDGRFSFHALGPDGEHIEYYDFDIRSQVPGKLYSFSQDGEPLSEQLPVLSTLPGDAGYNDFVRVYEVAVPPGYQANSVTSEGDVIASHFLVTPSDRIINRPVVPPGSSAVLRNRGADSTLALAWYQGEIASAFTFEDRVPSQSSDDYGDRAVDISDLYVTYNVNPGAPGGGPASGVRTEPDSDQTHNVAETLPGDSHYSPLWMLITYDAAAFDRVDSEASADEAPVVAGARSPLLNGPIVSVDERSEVGALEVDAGAADTSPMDAAPRDAGASEEVR